MKKLLKFVFNVIRNTSLFIVIIVSIFIAFLTMNESAARDFFASLDDQVEPVGDQDQDYEYEPFETIDIEEPALDVYKSKKIKIKVKNGFAYLRPSQIMYINIKDSLSLYTTNDMILGPKLKLYELDELLRNSPEECFFRIKSAIINCKYIQQIVNKAGTNFEKHGYQYQYVVIMENKDSIYIGNEKAKELIQILDQMTF